jgi:demethoxyubiquinone hydroxylase (CLK1/Coq7/Cat5 family)
MDPRVLSPIDRLLELADSGLAASFAKPAASRPTPGEPAANPLEPARRRHAAGLMLAGLFGDRASLGFMAETERQVEGHLAEHLERLPAGDLRSRSIVEQMQSDEVGHGRAAVEAGAMELPEPVPQLMRLAARIMTGTAYWV